MINQNKLLDNFTFITINYEQNCVGPFHNEKTFLALFGKEVCLLLEYCFKKINRNKVHNNINIMIIFKITRKSWFTCQPIKFERVFLLYVD